MYVDQKVSLLICILKCIVVTCHYHQLFCTWTYIAHSLRLYLGIRSCQECVTNWTMVDMIIWFQSYRYPSSSPSAPGTLHLHSLETINWPKKIVNRFDSLTSFSTIPSIRLDSRDAAIAQSNGLVVCTNASHSLTPFIISARLLLAWFL